MSKRIIKITTICLSLCLLCMICSTICVGIAVRPQQDVATEPLSYNDTFDTDKSLYSSGNSLYDPEAYIRSRYNVKSLSVQTVEIPSWSFSSQSSLNYSYNRTYGTNINGTCGVVVCTSVAYYYSTVKGYSNIPNDKDIIFAKLIRDYYHITGNEGTSSSSYKNAIPWIFNQYGYNMKASRVTHLWKYTKMREQAEAGVPTTFSTSGTDLYGSHAMVVIGYKKYTIVYDNNKTKTETYYMLDEGWGRNKAAYVMEDNMPGDWEITLIGK